MVNAIQNGDAVPIVNVKQKYRWRCTRVTSVFHACLGLVLTWKATDKTKLMDLEQ